MRQSFSDANISSASREIPRTLWEKSFITVSTKAGHVPLSRPIPLIQGTF